MIFIAGKAEFYQGIPRMVCYFYMINYIELWIYLKMLLTTFVRINVLAIAINLRPKLGYIIHQVKFEGKLSDEPGDVE